MKNNKKISTADFPIIAYITSFLIAIFSFRVIIQFSEKTRFELITTYFRRNRYKNTQCQFLNNSLYYPIFSCHISKYCNSFQFFQLLSNFSRKQTSATYQREKGQMRSKFRARDCSFNLYLWSIGVLKSWLLTA